MKPTRLSGLRGLSDLSWTDWTDGGINYVPEIGYTGPGSWENPVDSGAQYTGPGSWGSQVPIDPGTLYSGPGSVGNWSGPIQAMPAPSILPVAPPNTTTPWSSLITGVSSLFMPNGGNTGVVGPRPVTGYPTAGSPFPAPPAQATIMGVPKNVAVIGALGLAAFFLMGKRA